MARTQSKISGKMLITWCLLGGFIVFLLPQSLTSKFQGAFSYFFQTPLSFGRYITMSSRISRSITDVVSRKDYLQLENHLANITIERDEAYKKINELTGLKQRIPLANARFVLADVINESTATGHKKASINRGSADGLAAGQLVLADNSIIGSVSYVGSHNAEIALISDPSSKIPVIIENIEKIETPKFMLGNGTEAVIKLVKKKPHIGDKVFTHKKANFLEKPMIIGTVAECQKNADYPALWDVIVKPACDINTITDVAVIIMNPKN